MDTFMQEIANAQIKAIQKLHIKPDTGQNLSMVLRNIQPYDLSEKDNIEIAREVCSRWSEETKKLTEDPAKFEELYKEMIDDRRPQTPSDAVGRGGITNI